MPLTENYPDYQAYLLRIWRRGQNEPSHWQASLEDPHSGERYGFGDLNSLFAFLIHLTSKNSDDPTYK